MADHVSVPPGGAQANLEPGTRIGQYVIQQRIGSGGMAVVFSALDETLGRKVALKVLSPSLAHDEEFRQRFLRESRTIAMVEESHIVPVYGAGESGGVLYIATRLVPGGDLASLIHQQNGPFPPERVASLVTQIAAALDAAHGVGLIHRDVKPSNVLIDSTPGRSEHAYLSDFGLSKSASSNTSITAAGMFLGTPDYCAPEQVIGSPPLSARSDQYSLACVAYSLMSGTVPYQRGDTVATLFAHVQAPIPSVVANRPWLSTAVDAVMARGMAKDPAGRFNTCGEFAAALAAALGQSVSLASMPPGSVPPGSVPPGFVPLGPMPSPSTPPGSPAWGPPAGSPATPAPMRLQSSTRQIKPGLTRARKGMIAGIAAGVLVIAGAVSAVLALNHHSAPSPSPSASSNPLQSELTGSWTGSYTCNQGLTDFQMDITAAPNGTATATVNFYADPSNPNVPNGKYALTGTYSASGVSLTPNHWIQQPSGYVMVPFDANPLTGDDKSMTGTIPSQGCTTFTANKTS